jgi:superfamily II DNA/RNA helicase
VIIATPGRLNSLCGHVAENAAQDDEVAMCIKLDEVCELVIDEADMMLALGFKNALSWFAQLVNSESALGFRLVLTSATWGKETSANLSRFESIPNKNPCF